MANTNNYKYSYLKDKYHEAKNDRLNTEEESGFYGGNVLFSLREISILAEMAERDVWPDGKFGDDECVIWGMFHRLCE